METEISLKDNQEGKIVMFNIDEDEEGSDKKTDGIRVIDKNTPTAITVGTARTERALMTENRLISEVSEPRSDSMLIFEEKDK